MCAAPITDEHQHVVNLESRALMCTCRGCYLLFTAERRRCATAPYPTATCRFPDFSFGPGDWDDLQIPVGLVFLFKNSVQDRTVAFYPGRPVRPSPSSPSMPGSGSRPPTQTCA